MTLVASGDIHMLGSSAAPTRSIAFELYGSYTGPRNLTTMAIAAGDSSPYSMTEFYGYSACSDPTPGNIASVSGVDSGPYATISWNPSTNADNYRIQTAISPWTSWNPISDGGSYDAASPYTTTLGNGSWKARVAGENCSGLGNYTTSNAWTMS